MTSSIKITKPKNQALNYPCVRIRDDNGLVVRFIDENTGICLYSANDEFQIGYYSKNWMRATDSAWNDFHGTITITTD